MIGQAKLPGVGLEKALLILDVDETLLHSREEALQYPPNFRLDQYYVYLRPGLHEFLEHACRDYQMAIWSSASEDYVAECLENLGELSFKFEFIWSRSRCTRRMDHEAHEIQYLKDLSKVKRRGYPLERILIVDDTGGKVSRHYGNAIYVRPFNGDRKDRELFLLIEYLRKVKDVDNYRTLEKRGWRSSVEDSARMK